MTDDEAAEILEGLLGDGDADLTEEELEALQMAINALRGTNVN